MATACFRELGSWHRQLLHIFLHITEQFVRFCDIPHSTSGLVYSEIGSQLLSFSVQCCYLLSAWQLYRLQKKLWQTCFWGDDIEAQHCHLQSWSCGSSMTLSTWKLGHLPQHTYLCCQTCWELCIKPVAETKSTIVYRATFYTMYWVFSRLEKKLSWCCWTLLIGQDV